MQEATENPVNVIIVDEHPATRAGITSGLAGDPQIRLIASVGTASEALAAATGHQPDVIVLDVLLAGNAGWRLLSGLPLARPGAKLLVYSAITDPQTLSQALDAGADGCLPKTADTAQLGRAIHAVARGENVAVDEHAAARLTRRPRAKASLREQQVLLALAAGHSTDTIAQRLHLSPSTIKNHKASLFAKLGVHNTAAAVAEAFRDRLLE
jgi:DNA-binding NarL/FixJ family response regulator